ncbi:MAG: hypothetical protein Q8Q01_04855 [archaeon]|nr:hypothetical protein [archaeon]
MVTVCLTDANDLYSKRDIKALLNAADVRYKSYFDRFAGKTPEFNLFFEYDPEQGNKGTFFYYVSQETLPERLPLFLKGLRKIIPKIQPRYEGIGLIKPDNSIEISTGNRELEGIILGILSPHAN